MHSRHKVWFEKDDVASRLQIATTSSTFDRSAQSSEGKDVDSGSRRRGDQVDTRHSQGNLDVAANLRVE